MNIIGLSMSDRQYVKAFGHLADSTMQHGHIDSINFRFLPTPFQTEVVSTGPHDCLINGCQSITLIERQI